MYDLISIGNISIDLFFKGESLTHKDNRFQLAVGGKYFAKEYHTAVGGGGANVAIGAAKNGLKVAVAGKVGKNAFKSFILEELINGKVSTGLLDYEDNYINLSTIFLTEKGERTIVHYSTPHQHILSNEITLNKLKNAKILYLGNQPNVALSEREEILNHIKKFEVTTVVNLGVEDCRRKKQQLENFLKKIDILILNDHEFSELVKAPYKDIHFADDVVNWYAKFLKGKIVIITEGKKGSYAYLNGKVFHEKAVEVEKIVDSTGAGDGYTAGFISEYLKTKDIEKSMGKGSSYAAKILAKLGAN